jgi:hypothetical protein
MTATGTVRVERRIAAFLIQRATACAILAVLVLLPGARHAAAQDVKAAIEKANLYVEVSKATERAADSWDRYASWVNMKTGPTGKERYISYGLYPVYDIAGLLKEVRKVAGQRSASPKLETAMIRYLDAYEGLAPVLNRASDYYDRKGYLRDGMAEGRGLHARMVPLATTFMKEREAVLAELRPFVRDVERQELAVTEAREGKSKAWHVAHIVHAAGRVVDTFPKTRPTPMSSESLEEQMRALGPNTPGAKFDELIAGVVRPTGVVIDMKRFDPALKVYAEAVDAFDRFAAEKPDGLGRVKGAPRQLLDSLRALQAPLTRSQGRDFDGSDALVGRTVNAYFELLSASSGLSNSQLRFLQ